MRRLTALLLALLLLAAGCAGAEEAPKLTKNLVVLFTSDTHCGIESGWGFAGVYEVKEYYGKNNHVLLVDDGDAIQGEPVGNLSQGMNILTIMNNVGYDLAIPGNHEFDYGVDRFLELTNLAAYPYISCNFNRRGELLFDPYAIREFDGFKVAFVGATTPATPRSTVPAYFQAEDGSNLYGFMQDESGEALYGAVQQAVDAARGEGADFVILMGHLGNEAECSPWRYDDVIGHTSGIDVVLDGHSHDSEKNTVLNKEGKPVLRAACGTKLASIGVLTIKPDGTFDTELLTWDQKVPAPELLGLQNPAKDAVQQVVASMSSTLEEVVASTAVELLTVDPEKKNSNGGPIRIIRQAETNLGDLCADAYLKESQIGELALVNGGGIRWTKNFAPGDMTLNDIYSLFPYGNSLMVAEASGRQVMDALEWSVHKMPAEFGGFLQVSGVTFEVDPTIPTPCLGTENEVFAGVDDSMPRRVRNILVGGEPIDPERNYRVVSHSFLMEQEGDGYTMFKDCKTLIDFVKLDYQALIDYITETLEGVVGEQYESPYGQGRIVSAQAE